MIKFILFISIYLSTSVLLSQKGDTLFISSIYKEALTKGESYENLRKLCKDIGNRLSGSAAAQMAVEWGPDGIRVNTVSPGMTLTPMTHSAYTQPGVMAQRESRIPLRRIGQPEDIAKAVSFLMSSEANYITGADIVVDGGLTQTLMAYNPGWKT